MSLALRHRDGQVTDLPVARWYAPATVAERALLTTLDGPVLDLGCGPGRLANALAERGVAALGVDTSPHAVERTVAGGASALCRSVFDLLPGEGRWRAVLLFDGNIGIGGDPLRLLRRLRELLALDGAALVEVDPPGWASPVRRVRVERGADAGPWFDWAWVSADRLGAIAAAAGLTITRWHHPEQRWVARLEPA